MNRRGVTLMELIIAMSLLSLLSLAVVTSMRVGLSATERANSRLRANRKAAGAQNALAHQIAGFMPMAADCMTGPSKPPTRVRFFQGEPESMRFVSNYSLEEAGRGRPRILEFQVIPGEQSRGVRLIVNERLYTGPLSTGSVCGGFVQDPATGMQVLQFLPIETGPQSFVLADKLSHCRFSYREEQFPPIYERWVDRWIQIAWPTAVRIDMAPLEDDSAQIRPSPITAPIHITRDPMAAYADM